MRKSTLILVIGAIFGLAAQTSWTEYKIEACTIPLSDLLISEVKPLLALFNLKHVFVRANDGTHTSGLNFEPEQWIHFLDAKARIGTQNYEQAACSPILRTTDKNYFHNKWTEIKNEYDRAARIYRYSVLDKHCQTVTEEILHKLGYKIPLPTSCLLGQCRSTNQ